ncbi:gliding motility-associated C-terminal domain-containing protein [Kaistella chaponensis]|uniref:Gliding motility-associated C-terminal domain-containing protein n=1 Tax=Kaistella chaponensis TaxID=713588 RepID=A0A1N7NMZ5_9FLAO|nr:T9SS type B sorting domain-containing protein [Kaistella chaponensis]SIS99813.1 gliding motility-associated C-terminal domain-containing protein [Kaistella chaponensis]
MKKFLLLFFLFSFSISIFSQQLKTSSAYSFTENKGQIVDQDGKQNPAVQYLFNSDGLNVQIKNDGFSYDVYEVKKVPKKKSKRRESDLPQKNKLKTEYDLKYEYHRVDIDFVGANKNPEIIAEGKSVDYDNYYNIPNRPKGVENVHRYEKITFQNLYSNIDLVFFQPKDTLKPIEYNFIVNPGGKISDIQLKFKGATTKLKDGKLIMNLRFGEMQENIPHSWEEAGNLKKSINVGFKDLGNGVYGFNADRDVFDKVVVIDPVPTRIWGTLYGGNGYDTMEKLEIDEYNDLYLGGMTMSYDNYMATSGAYITTFTGTWDGYIAKFDENGHRIWGSYLDNTISYGSLNALDFDKDNLYILLKANDQQVLKLRKDGTYIWTHHIASDKLIYDILVKNGFFYIGGAIAQNNISKPYIEKFDLNGIFQKNYIIQNTVSGKFSYISDFSDDSSLDIYAIGQTESTGISTQNSLQNSLGGDRDLLLMHFDSDLNSKQISYFGDARADLPIACKFENGIFKVFYKIWPIINNNYVGSVLKYNVNTNAIVSNNQFLLPYNQDLTGYFDPIGNLFIGGSSYPNQPNIATPDAYQTSTGFSNKSIMMLYDNNENKVWGTFYGGNGSTGAAFIRRDSKNYIYMVGSATSNISGMATPGAFQSINNSTDGYIAKFFDCTSVVTLLSSNSPVCLNSTINLSASGGTSYSWTGPNGFISSAQNPIILNATAAMDGIYSCVISGTGGCDGTFNVEVKVEDKTAPIPDIANLLTITGNCKTVISTIPTATDNCVGNIVGITTDPLQYSLPGNYIIHWKYDDGNGNISTQNQNVTIVSEPVPTGNAAQNFCLINNPKISNIQISGTSIKWYNAAGNLLNANTLLVDGTKYYATQTLNGCESAKTEITIAVNDPIAPTGNGSQTFCSAQLPKISDILVTGQNIKWFDASGNILPTTTLLLDGKTYFATQTVNGCESTQKLSVTAIVKNGGIPANDYAMAICNPTTSNTKIENLINYKGNLIANPGIYIFEFFNAANQVIADPSNAILNLGANIFNVKISNNLGCFDFVKLTLTLDPKPPLNLPEKVEFCNGQSVPLDAGGNGIIAYEWTRTDDPKVISNQQILVVSTPGDYILKVENTFGCQNSTIIKVTKSVLAHITGVQIVNNTATVQMSAVGDFIYSLDQLNWQNSNVFQNLANGNYTVYVQTKLGCIIGSMNFSIFNVTNIFTPNADGMNDTWEISGLENYPNSEVKVFDRFGNTVLQKITNGAFEWDGTFNSRKLPTGNYWYVIKVSDGRLLNGWLLLKNRN